MVALVIVRLLVGREVGRRSLSRGMRSQYGSGLPRVSAGNFLDNPITRGFGGVPRGIFYPVSLLVLYWVSCSAKNCYRN